MKNKRFVFALMVLVLGSLFSNAQSTLAKTLRANLEKSKKHREAQLLKAREQQRQSQAGKRSEFSMNVSSQKDGNVKQNTEIIQKPNQSVNPAFKEQPLSTSVRKEDTNQ